MFSNYLVNKIKVNLSRVKNSFSRGKSWSIYESLIMILKSIQNLIKKIVINIFLRTFPIKGKNPGIKKIKLFQLLWPLVYFCQFKSYLSIVENNIILRKKYLSSSKSINSRWKVTQSENGQICPLSWCSELFRSVMHRLREISKIIKLLNFRFWSKKLNCHKNSLTVAVWMTVSCHLLKFTTLRRSSAAIWHLVLKLNGKYLLILKLTDFFKW